MLRDKVEVFPTSGIVQAIDGDDGAVPGVFETDRNVRAELFDREVEVLAPFDSNEITVDDVAAEGPLDREPRLQPRADFTVRPAEQQQEEYPKLLSDRHPWILRL